MKLLRKISSLSFSLLRLASFQGLFSIYANSYLFWSCTRVVHQSNSRYPITGQLCRMKISHSYFLLQVKVCFSMLPSANLNLSERGILISLLKLFIGKTTISFKGSIHLCSFSRQFFILGISCLNLFTDLIMQVMKCCANVSANSKTRTCGRHQEKV
jgi:hypothetical protein